jgi:23S rRNA U2552 (ribose-2'-O)-methylase RlmE/FtsJ
MHSVEFPILRATIRKKGDEEKCQSFGSSDIMKQLNIIKQKVPEVQSNIGRRTWDRLVDTAPYSVKRLKPMASRAYLKMKEMMTTCVIDYPSTSVHLCESPGGFVQAIGDEATHEWKWCAISLNDDGSPMPLYDLLPMDKGEFINGDIMDFSFCKNSLEEGKADLVTADGAYNIKHSSLESDHYPLLLAQTRVALYALAPRGTFVIKFFEGAELETLVYIAYLTQLFVAVSLIKPTSSRPTNSERYIVARDFVGSHDKEISDISQVIVSPAWIREMQILMDRFAKNQIEHLERALKQSASSCESHTSHTSHARPSSVAQVGLSQRNFSSNSSHRKKLDK